MSKKFRKVYIYNIYTSMGFKLFAVSDGHGLNGHHVS